MRPDAPAALEYVWRVKTRHPERYRQACAVLVRGPMNSCLVQFADGFKTVTSRWNVRRQTKESR